jgi:TonB family protein
MGKIVKYCNACEEGFAEKFVFCPNCGSGLTAFELNPVQTNVNVPPTEKLEPISVLNAETEIKPAFTEPILTVNEPIVEKVTAPIVAEEIIEPTTTFTTQIEQPTAAFTENIEEVITQNVAEKTVTISGFTPVFNQTKTFADDEYLGDESQPIRFRQQAESEYRPTFVEDKNRGNRLKLLLSSMALVLIVLSGSWVYSLFAKSLSVDSLDDEIFAYVTPPNDDPFEKEKEIIEKKVAEKGGGGGGGGKNEKEPTSQGQLARQMDKPDVPPSSRMDRVTDPALTLRVGTQGKAKTDIDPNQRYGDPKGGTTISDGTGSGGGQGSGVGTGQGRGEGTGRGNGKGSGSGNGNGNGNGDGTGDGDGEPPPPKKIPTPTPRPVQTPEPKVAVANNFKITAQPRANYTDAGRQNNVNGVVRLKVTFLASGQIGGISVVSGLPYGLTEQAIAAARNIRFVPGSGTISKTIEYRFTLY